MATDKSGLRDDVFVEMGEVSYTQRPGAVMQPSPRVPDRPADGAPKGKWVDYVVALGADRRFVTEDTEHHDAELGEAVTEPGLTRDELIELADRLGG